MATRTRTLLEIPHYTEDVALYSDKERRLAELRRLGWVILSAEMVTDAVCLRGPPPPQGGVHLTSTGAGFRIIYLAFGFFPS